MVKSKNRKKIQVKDFSNILFTTLARNLLHDGVQENLVLSQSILDVSRTVLMLSYIYRPIFREKFQDAWHFLQRDLKKNPALFAYTFSNILSENYSAFKFLVWCSFISELHLFLSYCQTGNKEEYYIKQSNIVFKDVFDLSFDADFYNFPQKWIQVFWTAAKIAKKFPLLKPFMNGRTSKETEKLVASCQDIIIGEDGLNENNELQTVLSIPGSSQKMNMDDDSLNRSFHNINEVKSASTPKQFLQVFDSLAYSHHENQTTQVRCLFLDRLMKRCSLGAEPNLEIYYDTDDSSAPIESPNVPPSNDCFSNSKSVESQKRTASMSKGNSPKRLKK